MKRTYLKDIAVRLSLCFGIVLITFLAVGHAQVPVAPAPVAHQQFFDASGKPLAGGRVYTYSAGTTTLLNTYIDSTGTAVNADPIILDAGGFADIWLANNSYKFVVQNSLGAQQWVRDNITGYLGIANLPNVWTLAQTFNAVTYFPLINNQLVFGALNNQTTLDVPQPSFNIVLHLPSTASDTLVARNTADNLTNKVLTNPVINGTTLTSPLNLAVVLFRSAVPVVHTGDLTDDTVYTVPLPVLGLNSILRITLAYNPMVQDANATTFRIKINGSVVVGASPGGAGQNYTGEWSVLIGNKNATNAQFALTKIWNSSAFVYNNATSAIDTSSASTLTITAQNATTSANSQTFYLLTVEQLP